MRRPRAVLGLREATRSRISLFLSTESSEEVGLVLAPDRFFILAAATPLERFIVVNDVQSALIRPAFSLQKNSTLGQVNKEVSIVRPAAESPIAIAITTLQKKTKKKNF